MRSGSLSPMRSRILFSTFTGAFQGESTIIGWYSASPWMFLVSALLTVAIDAALGWNRYFRFVVSSTDCNATWVWTYIWLNISMLQYPQDMILSTKLWLRIIDLDSITWANGFYSTILLGTVTDVKQLVSYEQVIRYRFNYKYIYM